MTAAPIHVIKHVIAGKSTTLCGFVGTRAIVGEREYETPTGGFLAVAAADPTQGPTCGKCRQVASTYRNKGGM